MIIHNLHLVWTILPLHEAHAPLVIDPDAVLSPPVATQSFQAIAGKSGQVCQTGSAVQDYDPLLPVMLA
jgi:hypothetical protein